MLLPSELHAFKNTQAEHENPSERSSRAAVPAQATTAARIVIIYAHDHGCLPFGPLRFACESHFSAPNFRDIQKTVECSGKNTNGLTFKCQLFLPYPEALGSLFSLFDPQYLLYNTTTNVD